MTTDTDLDRQAAERVMGWRWIDNPNEAQRLRVCEYCWVDADNNVRHSIRRHPPRWSPTKDYAHAFEVVERMREKGFLLSLRNQDSGWSAAFVGEDEIAHCAFTSTAPTAIVLAALSAVEGEK